MGIVWENMIPSTELPLDFCAGIGPLQLGGVLVFSLNKTTAIVSTETQQICWKFSQKNLDIMSEYGEEEEGEDEGPYIGVYEGEIVS